ncbi:MAG: isoprenylcysteine carboxylmethyltransferase family protein [Fidelibacterota bacterium]|nr:MAG: isoprenylcysteine carboxylmethyltransferase family protein [Candidatus Neomarinimicrobiota bacterium]
MRKRSLPTNNRHVRNQRLPERKFTRAGILWTILSTILYIVCFPLNPLILTGIVETSSHPVLFALGWVFWTIGMVFVMAPIVMFPRWGGVPKGKSFVHTTQLVDSGLYSLVRHPQYLGGILAIFITTMLFYPHWLFVILGVLGTTTLYMSCKEEEAYLIKQFGDEYRRYIKKVTRMNILVGFVRMLRRMVARRRNS